MKRFHVHVSVANLAESIGFYSTLFAAEPAARKPDYAKWMLEDPRINFAISQRDSEHGVDHLGFQVESDAELAEIGARLTTAELPRETQTEAACCYARSNKHWTIDPQGVAWESFHTLDSVPVYGSDRSTIGEAGVACCTPSELESAAQGGCCGPSTGKGKPGAQAGCCA